MRDRQVAGPYQVLEPRAGRAREHVGRHLLLDKRVALRILPADVASDADAVDRFLGAARAAARVRHPGVLPILDLGESSDGRAYLATELSDGPDLATVTRERGGWTWRKAREVGRQIGAVLRAAEAQGIGCGSLRPEDIFIEEGAGSLEVRLDLATAARVRRRHVADVEGAANVEGGVSDGGDDDGGGDGDGDGGDDDDDDGHVHLLGQLLYLMVGGESPADRAAAQVLVAPALFDPGLDLPHCADALISRALDADHGRRWEDLDSLLTALDRCGGSDAASVTQPRATVADGGVADEVYQRQVEAPPPDDGAGFARWRYLMLGAGSARRRYLMLGAGVALGVAVGAIAIAVLTDRSRLSAPRPPAVARVAPRPAAAPPAVGPIVAPHIEPAPAAPPPAPEAAPPAAPGRTIAAARPATAPAAAPPAAFPPAAAPPVAAPPAAAPPAATAPAASAASERPAAEEASADPEAAPPAGPSDCVVTLGSRPWSEVLIDGKPAGFTPVGRRSVACGAHEVLFRNPDLGIERRIRIDVVPGVPLKRIVALGAPGSVDVGARSVSARSGCVVSLGSRPWSEVWIDGERAGVTPLVDHSVSCGWHTVLFLNQDLNLERREAILVEEGEHFRKVVPLTTTATPRM